MGVPFEALLPYGVMITMFCITSVGLGALRRANNGGKPMRRSLDKWDKVMMERDKRLTGFMRGQSDKPTAPDGFELNNPWKTEKRIF